MQVSFRSKSLLPLLSDPGVTRFGYGIINRLTQKRFQKMGLWLLGSTGITLMLGWNWKLVLATLTGIGFMVFVYRIQGWNWQRRWYYWREFIKGSHGKLTIAVGSGSLAVISSYIAISIWSEAENHWLALGLILQGLGTFLTLGLLGWHLVDSRKKQPINQYHQWTLGLTDTDVLKRLIAVRNLEDLLERQKLNATQTQQLWEYFRLMLTKETEAVVRQAVLQCCQLLDKRKP